jgi:hypothetical protein
LKKPQASLTTFVVRSKPKNDAMRQVFLEGRALAILPCLADKGTRVPGGYKAAVPDQAGIARLFSKYRDPLIGVATGCINCIDVVDIDPRHGGDRFFHENRDRLPQTRTHVTQHDVGT